MFFCEVTQKRKKKYALKREKKRKEKNCERRRTREHKKSLLAVGEEGLKRIVLGPSVPDEESQNSSGDGGKEAELLSVFVKIYG